MPQTKTVGYQAADLDAVPAVDLFLRHLGVGALDRGTVRSVQGRNNNWVGRTSTGEEVFVKQVSALDRRPAMRRTRHVMEVGADVVRMPAVLGVDDAEGLVVSRFLPDASNGLELAAEEEFDERLAAEAGAIVAALHALPLDGFDDSPHPLPPLAAFDGLSLARFQEISNAELQMWSLLQNDRELIEALTHVQSRDRSDAPTYPRTPIHGDLRLDQFLVADETLYLSDFEETRQGDPARDIGAFAGEWLFQALSRLPATLAGVLSVGQVATHEQIVATGVAEIERRAPYVRAFTAAYVDRRSAAAADPELFTRSAAYAGWHMLDRMLASAAHANRLSPVNKAAAGIGRMLLLAPGDFARTIGLDQP